MPNSIERDVYVLRDALKNPISYVRGTDLLPIILHFRDFTIPSGATAKVFVAKNDGNAVYGGATITGNDVTVDVTQQMFITLGVNLMQVEIDSGNETLVTFEQPVMVTPNLKAGDLPDSTTDVDFIDKIIEQAQEAVNDANAALETANTAISGANTAAESANSAAQNANNAAEELQDKVDAGDFTASVQVGTTTTLEPGQDATVSNGGTNKDAVLNFGIPKGDPGTAATIQVGTTQTVQPEENAEVTNSGTTSAAVLNFKIPRGADGMTDLVAEYEDDSSYTCEPTSNAPVVVKQVDGKTEQVTTTGTQLFDVESYPFTDGYWIDYNLGYISSNENYKCTNFVPFLGYDGLTISLSPVPSGSNQGMAFYSSNNQESYLSGGKGNAITVPEGTQYMRFTVDSSVSDNVVMLNKGSTPLPWEPYTGGEPSPSPENPQVIKGVGGTGYFDGAWRQGYYNSTAPGQYVLADNYVCNANKISCKAGDIISINYDDNETSDNGIVYYDVNGVYISWTKSLNDTAPQNAKYFNFRINKTGISPQTAKYCTVTINGEYATAVETQGRNLAEVTQTNKNLTINGVTFNLNDNGSYTLNGTRTGEDTVVLLNQPIGRDTSDFPSIVKLKSGLKYRIKDCQLFLRNSENPNGFTSSSTDGMVSNAFYTPTEDTEVIGIRALIRNGTTYSSTRTYYPGIWEDPDETRTEWVPFKRTSITIPLTAPLFDGDKICYVKPGESYVDADGDTVIADGILYGCYRENAEVVFDGSEDEGWIFDSIYNNRCLIILDKIKLTTYTTEIGKCNLFEYNDSVYFDARNELGYCISSKNLYIRFTSSSTINSNAALRDFLQENNLILVYPLATPYFEPFADQSIFYDLRTDDTLTYIYSSDPINPNITVDVAKNETGGILLESYATAQKNALAEADNASRLAEVEQQLLTLNTTVSTMGGGSE